MFVYPYVHLPYIQCGQLALVMWTVGRVQMTTLLSLYPIEAAHENRKTMKPR